MFSFKIKGGDPSTNHITAMYKPCSLYHSKIKPHFKTWLFCLILSKCKKIRVWEGCQNILHLWCLITGGNQKRMNGYHTTAVKPICSSILDATVWLNILT